MLLSSAGGLILDFAVARYKPSEILGGKLLTLRWRGIAVFQPVMNGVGGNLVAVQVSDDHSQSGYGVDIFPHFHCQIIRRPLLQASRLSTDLHCNTEGRGPGSLPQGEKVKAQKKNNYNSCRSGLLLPLPCFNTLRQGSAFHHSKVYLCFPPSSL